MKQCTIQINDEVNIKIEGLDLDARKALVKAFKYDIPYARYLPAVRLGRWDGKMSYFQLGGSTYTNLLPDIIPLLERFDYDIELDDRREYSTTFEFDRVSEQSYANKLWPKAHPAEGQPILLRDYQVEIVNNFLSNPQCIQEVATGAGKTIMTAALSDAVSKYGRSIVIVPNKSLVTQTEKDYINMELDVGVYFGDRKEYGRQHTICTWQSLNVLDKKSYDDEVLSLAEFTAGVSAIIIDEVQQAKAEVLTKLLTQNFSNCAIRWGLTGTIPKEAWEFQGILASIGPVINQVSAHDLQEKGVLAQLQINILQTNEVQVFRSFADEYAFLVTDDSRITWMANKIQSLALTGNTLVLINRIDTGNKLIERIPEAVFVSGGMKLDDRKEEYDEIKTSDGKIIVATYGVAAVGINIPRIFNLVLVEPGKSFVRVIQSIGRGIRKAEDKDHVEIWDITSQCKYSKRHLTERKKFYKDAKYPFSITKVSI